MHKTTAIMDGPSSSFCRRCKSCGTVKICPEALEEEHKLLLRSTNSLSTKLEAEQASHKTSTRYGWSLVETKRFLTTGFTTMQ